MSVEGDVNLDALIEKDKSEARQRKHKQIEKERRERYDRNRNRERERQNRDHRNRNDRNDRSEGVWERGHGVKAENDRNDRRGNRTEYQQKNPLSQNTYYAVSISGLLSDVSVDDICNLLGDRKVISVRTTLRNKDNTTLNTKSPSLMRVTIVLEDKNQADSFVKQYSDKKFDGKYELNFSFIDANKELE